MCPIIIAASTCSQWNVECDRSASRVSYTPHDLSGLFNPTTVSLGIENDFLRRGLGTGQDETPVYIYPVNTSAECNSTLVAIQYCYVRTEVSDQHSLHTVATFLALDRDDDSGVIAYREFPLQSNEASGGANCTSDAGRTYCCVITNLSDSQQFSIPSSPLTPFAFGLVVNRSSDVQLMSFNTYSSTGAIIDAYQVSSYTRGQRLVLEEEQLGLPLIRLGIGELSEVVTSTESKSTCLMITQSHRNILFPIATAVIVRYVARIGGSLCMTFNTGIMEV